MVAGPRVIEQTIETYKAAARASSETSGRRGNVVAIGQHPGGEVMVTADLHGNRLNFDQLLRIADLDQFPDRHLVMQEVCHGGPQYPSADLPSSEGCMSHLLLEDVARLKAAHPDRFHFLLSNHEWAEMVDFPITKSRKLLNLTFRSGLQRMYGDAVDVVRSALVEFLASCPLAVRVLEDLVICHSAPARIDEEGFDAGIFDRPLSPDDLRPHSDLFRLLWGRDFSEANGRRFAELLGAKVLIHGHEPCPAGFAVPNRYQLILDCCGNRGSYAVLSTERQLSQADVLEGVRLFESV